MEVSVLFKDKLWYGNTSCYDSRKAYSLKFKTNLLTPKEMLWICQKFIRFEYFSSLSYDFKKENYCVMFTDENEREDFKNNKTIFFAFCVEKYYRKILNEELLLLPPKGPFPGGYEYQIAKENYEELKIKNTKVN